MDDLKNLKDPWTEIWNERYSQDQYAYGEEPNNYLKEKLPQLPVGIILFPAEGEGRNAVYAAQLGWKVFAFDISKEGKNKALKLAEKNKVTINYTVGKLETIEYAPGQFDAIALIYAHFPANIKSMYHKILNEYLKPGGTIIFESFSKKHMDYLKADDKVGGPKDVDMMFSVDEIKADFPDYEIVEMKEQEINLNEGLFHNGTGSVIRFVGLKKTLKQ